VALLTVDGWRSKAPSNKIKNAAREAFDFAAAELGLSSDALSDRIVPDFGFDRRGEKTLDYGSRSFRLTLNPDFSVSIYDKTAGKALKSLPAPGAADDKAKAEAAKKELGELKKALKAVVKNQSFRLEKILANGRIWTACAWTKLFVENPLMYRFAVGLVWGIYPESGGLLTSFRYMDDGSFNTIDEEEYALPPDARISLAHPIEMGEDTTKKWVALFGDYEIAQPIPQLAARINTLTGKDMEGNFIIRYRGIKTTAGKLLGLSKKYDMRRGDVEDAGSYMNFFLEDSWLRAGAAINFDSMYMGIDPTETVSLGDAAFYRIADEGSRLPFEWGGDAKPENAADPKSLPARYVSGILNIFDGLLE
jgi:hypothetical protein